MMSEDETFVARCLERDPLSSGKVQTGHPHSPLGGKDLPIVKLVLDEIGKGKTADAQVWYSQQPKLKAYIAPRAAQMSNLSLPTEDGSLLLSDLMAVNRLMGLDIKAIVIDELDQFENPFATIKEILSHVRAKIYICGTPKIGIGVSPLIFLAMTLDSMLQGFGKQQLGPEIIYGTPEIAKAVRDSYDMLNLMGSFFHLEIDTGRSE